MRTVTITRVSDNTGQTVLVEQRDRILIITINRRYKVRDGGFRFTGRDAWGVPTT